MARVMIKEPAFDGALKRTRVRYQLVVMVLLALHLHCFFRWRFVPIRCFFLSPFIQANLL